jgi:AcrR family transcriptional regulator
VKRRPPPKPTETETDDEKREHRRLALRTAAYKRFSERGYHLTTVDDICEEAKISKGSFYWYYDSKQAVLLAIVDGWSHDVEVALTEHFRSTIESANRRAAVTAGLQALSRKLSRLMPLWLEFLSQAQREPAIREGLQLFHRRVRRATHKLLGELVKDFESERESEALATIIVGGFIGLMALELSDPDEVTFSKKVASFMHLLGHSSIDAREETKAEPPAKKLAARVPAPRATTSKKKSKR